VIGNGDIRTPHDAVRMINHTKCAGVMIGRGALSMPWIFRDTWAQLTTGQVPPPPTLEEKCQLMTDHFNYMVQFRGERPAICEIRKRVSWWAKTMHPCRMLRDPMRLVSSSEEFHRLVGEFLDWRSSARPEDLIEDEAPAMSA